MSTMTLSTPLPTEVSDSIEKWMGTSDLLHWWEQDGTYFVVVKSDLLYFLRLFRMGGEYVLSQDREVEL